MAGAQCMVGSIDLLISLIQRPGSCFQQRRVSGYLRAMMLKDKVSEKPTHVTIWASGLSPSLLPLVIIHAALRIITDYNLFLLEKLPSLSNPDKRHCLTPSYLLLLL